MAEALGEDGHGGELVALLVGVVEDHDLGECRDGFGWDFFAEAHVYRPVAASAADSPPRGGGGWWIGGVEECGEVLVWFHGLAIRIEE